jgi:hypothetical protein
VYLGLLASVYDSLEVTMIGSGRILLLPPVFAAVLLLSACGALSRGVPSSDRERGTSGDLTETDLRDYSTVMEAVQALRAGWLRERTPLVLSPRSGTEPANPVWVYWDGTRLGDPSHLARIATGDVSRVMHFDARSASVRWGVGHENGVIYLVPAVGSVGPGFR